jgi:hypothetical protein
MKIYKLLVIACIFVLSLSKNDFDRRKRSRLAKKVELKALARINKLRQSPRAMIGDV